MRKANRRVNSPSSTGSLEALARTGAWGDFLAQLREKPLAEPKLVQLFTSVAAIVNYPAAVNSSLAEALNGLLLQIFRRVISETFDHCELPNTPQGFKESLVWAVSIDQIRSRAALILAVYAPALLISLQSEESVLAEATRTFLADIHQHLGGASFHQTFARLTYQFFQANLSGLERFWAGAYDTDHRQGANLWTSDMDRIADVLGLESGFAESNLLRFAAVSLICWGWGSLDSEDEAGLESLVTFFAESQDSELHLALLDGAFDAVERKPFIDSIHWITTTYSSYIETKGCLKLKLAEWYSKLGFSEKASFCRVLAVEELLEAHYELERAEPDPRGYESSGDRTHSIMHSFNEVIKAFNLIMKAPISTSWVETTEWSDLGSGGPYLSEKVLFAVCWLLTDHGEEKARKILRKESWYWRFAELEFQTLQALFQANPHIIPVVFPKVGDDPKLLTVFYVALFFDPSIDEAKPNFSLAKQALEAMTENQRELLKIPILRGKTGIIERTLCRLWAPQYGDDASHWKGVATLLEREDVRLALQTLRNYFSETK